MTLAKEIGRTGGDVASRRSRAHHRAANRRAVMFTPSSASTSPALREAGVERRSNVERHDTPPRNGSRLVTSTQRAPHPRSPRGSCEPLHFHDNRAIVRWRPFQAAMILSS